MTDGNCLKGRKIFVYDSTLRDGAQAEGISFTVADKLKIVKKLDDFGVDYIEAGNPGSNPKDLEFFERIKTMELANAKLVAFGSTRRAGITPQQDANLAALLGTDTSAVAIFGKSWDFHVTEVIHTTLEENLSMIYDSVSYMKEKGREVIFDASTSLTDTRLIPTMQCVLLKPLPTPELIGWSCAIPMEAPFPPRYIK